MLGDSALIMLCDGNDCFGTMPTLDLLLSVDLVSANVNTPNLSGDTALMAACENNLCEVVEVLLRRGRADVHVQNRDGETAAVLALLMCNFDVLELLLLYGVDVNESLPNYCEDTLLLGACAHGREEAVHFLLKHGATADQGRASNCETPLVAASRAGNASIVTLLLQHGADADAALYWACACGHVEVVKILLYHGVELETVSPEGDTALQVACRRGDLVTVRLLQQQGATLDTLDSCGRSALMWAIRSGRSDMASFLLDKGCAAHRLCEDFDVRISLDLQCFKLVCDGISSRLLAVVMCSRRTATCPPRCSTWRPPPAMPARCSCYCTTAPPLAGRWPPCSVTTIW